MPTRAIFNHYDLNGADLIRAYGTGADLTGASLRHADLTGANFMEATIVGVKVKNAVIERDYSKERHKELLRMQQDQEEQPTLF